MVLAPELDEEDDLNDLYSVSGESEDGCDADVCDSHIDAAVLEVQRSDILSPRDIFCSPNTVILDNGAGDSIFRHTRLLTGLHKAEVPVIFQGVNSRAKPIQTDVVGNTIFGPVYHSYSAIGNILSFSRAVDACDIVSYDGDRDCFVLTPSLINGISYYFNRHPSNLYVCNIRTDKFEDAEDGILAGVTTVSENMLKYSKREVRRAQLAREYLRRSNYNWTDGTLIKQLNAGKIKNAEITSHDVLRAIDIWGKSIGTLKGKTTPHKTPATTFEPIVLDPSIQRDQEMLADIMFIEGRPYLLARFDPLRFPMAKRLRSRGKYELLRVLQLMINWVQKTGLKVGLLRCDGESAIVSDYIASKLSVPIDTTGGQEAVQAIERLIRTIRERVRAVITTLPFRLTAQLED